MHQPSPCLRLTAINPSRWTKKTHRRPWLILGGLFLTALGVLGWLVAIHDDPPPDDAHLMPQWSERGGSANPLAVFCSRLEHSRIHAHMYDVPIMVRQGFPAHTAEVQAVLDAHKREMEAFDILMGTDPRTWQWDIATSLESAEAGSPSRYPIEGVGQMLRMRARSLGWQDRPGEGVEECLRLVRFAAGLQNAEGQVQDLATANSIRWLAEDGLQTVLTSPKATPEMVRLCLRELMAHPEPGPGAWQQAARLDYARFKRYASHITNAEMSRLLNPEPNALLPLYYKRNRTLALKVPISTARLKAASQGWRALEQWEQANQLRFKSWSPPWDSKRVYLDPNFVGEAVFNGSEQRGILPPGFGQGFTLLRQTALMLALRLHELEKGNLPATLEALIPAYLPDVPVDEFTDKPMLWNASREVLYSTGEDVKDDGGDVIHMGPGMPPKDLGAVYWWSKHALR